MSYLGKDVTASVYNVGGDIETTTGKVTNVSLVGDDYKLTVNGKEFSLADIKSVSESTPVQEVQPDTDILTAASVNELYKEE